MKAGICFPGGTTDHFGVLDFQVEVYVYVCAGILLLCITTFVPLTVEILRVHTLCLPLENLKLQSVKPRESLSKCSSYVLYPVPGLYHVIHNLSMSYISIPSFQMSGYPFIAVVMYMHRSCYHGVHFTLKSMEEGRPKMGNSQFLYTFIYSSSFSFSLFIPMNLHTDGRRFCIRKFPIFFTPTC